MENALTIIAVLGGLLFVYSFIKYALTGFRYHPVTGLLALIPVVNIITLPTLMDSKIIRLIIFGIILVIKFQYNLIVLGIILLIILGIILAIKFQFFGYFIVDKGDGPIEALKKSSAITTGAKWNLFLLYLLLLLINLLGAIFLLIGLFVTIPTTMVAIAFVYRKLLNSNRDYAS